MGSKWTPEKQAKAKRTNELRRIVDDYLTALEEQPSKKGGSRLSIEELQQRRERAAAEALELTGVKKLLKLQEAQDWSEKLSMTTAPVLEIDIKALEEAFIEVAAEYSEAKGISYAAWRGIGVSVEALKAAGIKRPRS